MNRTLRTLGIAFVAVLALSAFAASAAQAEQSFTVTEIPASLTGEVDGTSNDVFTTAKGTVECNKISFTGTTSVLKATEQSITPKYEECTGFGFTTHVTTTGCTYQFTTPKTVAGLLTGDPPHIVCTAGNSIKLTPTFLGASVCTSTIAAQTPTGGHIIYTNIGPTGNEEYVTLHTTVTGIHYVGNGSVCGENKTNIDGTYNGLENLTAFKDPSKHETTDRIGVTVSP
jgi:hypothetical protein